MCFAPIGGLVGQIIWLLEELGVRMDKGGEVEENGRQLAPWKQGRKVKNAWLHGMLPLAC